MNKLILNHKKARKKPIKEADDVRISAASSQKKGFAEFSLDDSVNTLRSRIISVFGPALFLTFTFFVFGPIQLYITNADELFFSLSDIWWICGLAGLVLCSLLTGLGTILRIKGSGNLGRYYCCVLWGIALGLYIQGNYIPTSYTTIDGTIDWNNYTDVAGWNTAVWVVCLILPFALNRFAPKLWKHCRDYVSVGIVAVQIITLGILLLTTDISREREYSLIEKGKLELSNGHNIIVFVLDAYDSKYFSDFIEENPEYKETVLSDFTFYPNTAGGAARTVVAMPQILTGKFYDSGNGLSQYLEDSYHSADLYRKLNAAEYSIGLYTEPEYVLPELDDYVMNLSLAGKAVQSHTKLAYYLFRFTACRYFPHILKSTVWTYAEDFDRAADNSGSEKSPYLWNDALFYQTLEEEGLSVQNRGNAFRLYHLVGAHGPYVLTEQCEQDDGGTSLKEQQKGVMTLLNTYFSQMQQLGIYDDADIVILADHGELDKGQNPLLLIKHGTETDQFTVNDVPVSYANLHATFLSLAAQNGGNEKSIFDLTEEDNSVRYFYLQTGDTETEFIINGDARSPESIQPTGRTFQMYQSGGKYQLGTMLYADIRGTICQYMVEGFSKIETDHIWTDGTRAVLHFPLEEPLIDDVTVSLVADPVGGRQHIGIYVNDILLNYYLMSTGNLDFMIPAGMVEGNELTIRFELPDAGYVGADSRLLALAFRSIVISPRKENDVESTVISYRLGDTIAFTDNDDGRRYFGAGISHIETDFAWSLGKSGQMYIGLGENTGNLMAEFRFKRVYAPPQKLIICCQGLTLFDSELSSGEVPICFTIPEACIENGWLLLDLEYPDADSPKNRGESEDDRELAFSFESICFYPSEE